MRLFWFLFLASACGSGRPLPAEPRQRTTNFAAPTSATRPPTARGAEPPAAESVPAVPSTVAKAPPVPVFRIVTQAPVGARLHALPGALLIESETASPGGTGGVDDELISGSWIGLFQDGAFVFPKRLFLEGLFHRVITIQGHYPDDVHMLAVGDTGRTGIAEHYTFDAKKGWRQEHAEVGSWFVGMAPFGRAIVGLKAPTMVGSAEFVALSGPKVRPRLRDASVCPKGEWQHRETHSRFLHAALSSTRGGDLLAFGNDCLGPAAFEIWKGNSRDSTVLALPTGGPGTVQLESGVVLTRGSGDDAWLLPDGLHLYHYQDGAVSEVKLPEGGPCSTVQSIPQGDVWVLCGGRAFRQVATEWLPQEASRGLLLDELVTTADGEVWALGEGKLLRVMSDEEALALASDRSAGASQGEAGEAGTGSTTTAARKPVSAAEKKRRRRLPSAGGASCAHNLVVLYAFAKTTPLNYDFPLTRKALRGHTEFRSVRFVVTRDVGQRFFSALVPSYAVGKQLQALIHQEVEGSKPSVVCAEPEIERELNIDLSGP